MQTKDHNEHTNRVPERNQPCSSRPSLPSRVACWLLVSCLVKDPWRYDDVLALRQYDQQSPELGFGYQSRGRDITASADYYMRD
jgi:hypothetical protein